MREKIGAPLRRGRGSTTRRLCGSCRSKGGIGGVYRNHINNIVLFKMNTSGYYLFFTIRRVLRCKSLTMNNLWLNQGAIFYKNSKFSRIWSLENINLSKSKIVSRALKIWALFMLIINSIHSQLTTYITAKQVLKGFLILRFKLELVFPHYYLLSRVFS